MKKSFELRAAADSAERALLIDGQPIPHVNHVHLDLGARGPAQLLVRQVLRAGTAQGEAEITLLRELVSLDRDPLNIRFEGSAPLYQQYDGYIRHLLRGAASTGDQVGVGTADVGGRRVTYLYVLQPARDTPPSEEPA